MEGPSVLGPCSWHKRRAWVRQSRGWRGPAPGGEREDEEEEEEEEEEEQQEAAAVPWEPPPQLDEGSVCSKIQTWLRDCGAAALEQPRPPGPCAGDSSGTSFEDDLSLGAEALLLPGSRQAASSVPSPLRAQRDRHLSLGDSMASSVPSGVPSSVPSSSSLSQLLAWCQSDAEEILHALGFVGSEPGGAARVPPRFFSAPSRASGIDLRLFLRAQERRRETEDPCLQLASRFQQVQTLAATADAFFCLYSYVSRTPLQRIAPARPYRDIPDSPERPGERLKRAVTSLCLYTGGGHGDIPRGGTLGETPSTPGAGGLREDPEGWRRDRDTGAARRLSPRSNPVGTAWGHPERCCPHGRGVWGSGGAPSPAAAARGDTGGDVTTPGPPRGDTGLGSPCHQSVTARAGGHRHGTPGRVPKPLRDPRGAAESLEMEEVLSEEEEDGEDEDDDQDEDEDEDDDDEDDEDEDDEAAHCPHSSVRTLRSSLFPGRSHSSGFAEEPLPPWAPPRVT